MNILKKNLIIIKNLKDQKHIMTHLKYTNEKLFIDGLEIDLNKIDLAQIFNNKIIEHIEKITITDIKKLALIALEKERMQEEKLANETPENFRIMNFQILNKVREDGTYLEYPYYVDENNRIYVLFNYAKTDIINEYQKLFLESQGQLTGRDLYEHFARKMPKIELTPDYKNPHMSEENKFESELINKQNKSQRVYLNQEHDLYSLGTTLYVHNFQNGNLNQNIYNHESPSEKSSYYDQFTSTRITMAPANHQMGHIITIQKYLKLIKFYNNLHKPEIGLFEVFMENLMQYQDYISEDMKKILWLYQYNMEIIEFKKFATSFELEALKRYRTIQDKIQYNYSNLKKENVKIRMRKLEEEYRKRRLLFNY